MRKQWMKLNTWKIQVRCQERLLGDPGGTDRAFCSLFGSRCFTPPGIHCFAPAPKHLREEIPSCHHSWEDHPVKSRPREERRAARAATEHSSAAYLLSRPSPCSDTNCSRKYWQNRLRDAVSFLTPRAARGERTC